MTSIKIMLDEEQKKEIKKASVDEGKTISRYILDRLEESTAYAYIKEINAISEQLTRQGGKMSQEERAALKQRREHLQGLVV